MARVVQFKATAGHRATGRIIAHLFAVVVLTPVFAVGTAFLETPIASAGCGAISAQLVVDGRFADGNPVNGTRSKGAMIAYLRPGAAACPLAGDYSSVSTVQMFNPAGGFIEVGFLSHEPAVPGAPRSLNLFVEHSSPGVDGGKTHFLTYGMPCTFGDGSQVWALIRSDLSGSSSQNWTTWWSCDNSTYYQLQCSAQPSGVCVSGAWHVDNASGQSVGEEESYGGALPYDIHRSLQSYYGGYYIWPAQTCRYFNPRPAGWKYYPYNDGAGGSPTNAFIIYGGSLSGC